MNRESEVLAILYRDIGHFQSGEKLAASLNCSRMTVTNLIASLKNRGFDIESQPHVGHKLVGLGDMLNEHSLRLFCSEPIFYFDSLSSTFIKGRELGLDGVVVARCQTGGFGRRKRAFDCSPGGAYFGYRFTPSLPAYRANLITLAAGIAVCQAVAAYNIPAKVKYPNDCLLDGKKFCGILTESVISGDTLESVNIGIGINIHNELSAELTEIATNLDAFGGAEILRAQLIGQVVARIKDILSEPETIVSRYEALSHFVPGMTLKLSQDTATSAATYVGVDRDGFLLARVGETINRVTIGEVTLREENRE